MKRNNASKAANMYFQVPRVLTACKVCTVNTHTVHLITFYQLETYYARNAIIYEYNLIMKNYDSIMTTKEFLYAGIVITARIE